MLASIPGIPLWIAILVIVIGGFSALAASGFKRALALIAIAAGVLACFHPTRETKTWDFVGTGTPWAVLSDPDKEKAVREIVSDPRYPGPEKFFNLLRSFGEFKKQVTERRLVEKVNASYGWHLSPDGNWTVPQTNDVLYEIIGKPGFDTAEAVTAIASGRKPSGAGAASASAGLDNQDIGQIDADLASKIQRYKSLWSSGQGEAAIEAIDSVRPDLEEFVAAHPNNPAGHLELSGLFINPVYIAVDSVPAGPKRASTAISAVQPDKISKARHELAEWKRLAGPNDPRMAAAEKLQSALDSIAKRK